MPKVTIPKTFQLPKYPNWYTLPQPNIKNIEADYRIESEIDANGVGRIRVKPGYNINVDEIRYEHRP